jgi:hypothetical protein
VSGEPRRRSRQTDWPGDPSRSVFINCPFDPRYAKLFDAILFATVCCGFSPRSALDSGSVGEPRLARITRAIFSSRYSIHDLSRCTGEGGENLARFNMPLELGMAMARRYMGTANDHEWLILAPKGHAYLRFVSDLAAFDPATHDGTVKGVVFAVMPWLATREGRIPPVTPTQVLAAFPRFRAEKENVSGLGRVSALARDCLGRDPRREEDLNQRSLPTTI